MAKLSPDNHLSGSVLPAWLGFSPWQSAYDILERARAFDAGEPRPELDSLQADIGSAVETIVLERGLRQIELDPTRVYHHTKDGEPVAKKHPEMELYYSDDGLFHMEQPQKIYSNESAGISVMNSDGEVTLQGTIVLEAKFTTVPKKPDDPPLYRGPIQLQAGMMVHNADFGILFTCYAGRNIDVHVFERHEDTVRMITQAVADFEQHRSEGTWPEPTNIEQMSYKYTEPDPEPEIELDPDLARVVEVYQDGVNAVKAGEQLKAEATQTLMGALGNHKIGRVISSTGKEYKVTWPWRTSKAKPPKLCPHCQAELEAAKPESTNRQKSISVKES